MDDQPRSQPQTWLDWCFSNRRSLASLGLLLLGLWTYWWISSLRADKLTSGQRTWIPPANWLGVDFLSNYHASRHWLAGGNPYTEDYGDPLHRPFVYSPVMLVLFAWCRFVTPQMAVLIWTGALAAMALLGSFLAWRSRRQLDLANLPWLFVAGVFLFSTPIIFELERGNCDLLVLMLAALASGLLTKRSWLRDSTAGGCVALAIWIKIYPAVLVLGLLAARRFRAVVCVVLIYAAVGLALWPDTWQHVQNMRSYVGDYDIGFHASAHPFSTYWKHLWEGTRLAILNRVPGAMGASLVLLPGLLWVSFHVARTGPHRGLLFPYFCWLIAAATFVPPVSNDYNLFFLTVAVLSVWDRRQSMAAHLALAPLLLWWQPLALAIGPQLLFGFKLLGLAGAGMCLVSRCLEGRQSTVDRQPALHAGMAVAA